MMKGVSSTKRNKAFDLLKVFFLLLIIIHHSGVISFHECLYLGVDLFFIISGYLLYQSYERRSEESILSLIRHRLIRLYPQYLMAMIPLLLLYLATGRNLRYEHPIAFFYEILMIQNIGLPYSGGVNYPCWYISVMMFTTILFFLIWKVVRTGKNRLILSAILAAVLYLIVFISDPATLEQWENIGIIFSLPLLRGIAGMATGVALCLLPKEFKGIPFADLLLLIVITIAMFTPVSEYLILMLMILLVASVTSGDTFLGEVGDSRLIRFLIKHEYTMFLNHALIITIFSFLLKDRVPQGIYTIIILFAVVSYSILLDMLETKLKKNMRKLRI